MIQEENSKKLSSQIIQDKKQSSCNSNWFAFQQSLFIKDNITKDQYKLIKCQHSTVSSQLFEIRKNNQVLGYYGTQGKFYKIIKLLFPKLVTERHVNNVLSKKIFPDAFIISIKSNKLTIFESKWQGTIGSTDEKIQTAPFKIEMLEKLLSKTKLIISYHYILSEWFKKPCYRNIREYYEFKPKINVWIQKDNLKKINIKKFIE